MHSTQYHTFPKNHWDTYCLQSVPIFLILMGTVWRNVPERERIQLASPISRKRIRRIVVPLIPVFFATIFSRIPLREKTTLLRFGQKSNRRDARLPGPGELFHLPSHLRQSLSFPTLWWLARKDFYDPDACCLVPHFPWTLNFSRNPVCSQWLLRKPVLFCCRYLFEWRYH